MNRDRIYSVLVFLGVFVFLLFRVLLIWTRWRALSLRLGRREGESGQE